MTSGLGALRTDWLVALRVARREARRAKGRTALVVALIGLPVVALTSTVATLAMHRLTPQEKVTRLMGGASAVVSFAGEEPFREPVELVANGESLIGTGTPRPAADLVRLLPAGATVAPFWTGSVSMNTAAGQGQFRAYGMDAGPLTDGLLRLWSGRLPTRDGEIAVTPGALARFDVPVGATVTDADGEVLRIVGTAEVGGNLTDALVFPQAARPTDQLGQAWLVGQPGPMLMPEVTALNQHGIMVQSRALILNPPPGIVVSGGGDSIAGVPTFKLSIVAGGLAAVETVLLVGSAFAVGARRRQRELALVATVGATPAQLRRIVLGDGVVAGLLAGAVGLVAGVATALVARPWFEQHVFHVRSGGYHMQPAALAGVAVLAVVTGILAAVVPAFTAARLEVVAALAGRRGATRSKRRWLLLGIAATALGAAGATGGAYRHSTDTVLAGLIVAELGLVLCTPTIVGLVARVGRDPPAAPRMALRDASRRRAAAAPAIAAVMAAVAGSIAITVYLGSVEQQQRGTYLAAAPTGTVMLRGAPTDQLTAAARAVLPGAPTVAYQTSVCPPADASCGPPVISLETPPDRRCPYAVGDQLSDAEQAKARADHRCDLSSRVIAGDIAPIVTDDPAVVSAATGLTGAALDEAVATLRAGGVLTGAARLVEDGRATIGGPKHITVPAYVVRTGVGLYYPILSPGAAAAEGLTTQDVGVIVTPATPPDQRVTDALTAAVGKIQGASFYIEQGAPTDGSPVGVILAIAAGVVALGAAGIATGLAAADSRRDLATLAAVGASPRVRRTMSLAQSGVIAGLGSLIGAVAGFAAAAAILTGLNQVYAGVWPAPNPYPIEVPWTNLAIALVAVPLVAMGAAGLLTRSRIPSERRAD